MGRRSAGGGGGPGGTITINASHYFADDTARNTYFSTHSSELVDGIYVVSGTELQHRINGAWVDESVVVKGEKGDTGDTGSAGSNGKTILYGAVDPTTEGVDGDWYINTAIHYIFGPKATTWPAGASLIGSQGEQGIQGEQGETGNGVPTGGTTGQVLKKKSDTNYDTEWGTGGEGGVSDHGSLTGLSDDDHPQYILHSIGTAANDMLMASGAGVFVKKTLAEVKAALGLGGAAYLNVGSASGTVAAGDDSRFSTIPTKASGSDIITGTDDAKFLTSKALKDAAAKRSIFLSLAGGWTGTTLPDGGFVTTETSTNKINFKGTNMAASASDQKHEFGCVMPGNYDGSTITAKAVMFVPTSTDASDHTIIFGLQAVAFADGDAGDTAYGSAQEVTITASASLAGKVKISAESSGITIGNTPAAGKWTQFRCYRKGDDTYTGDVTLLGWIITFGISKYSDA